MARNGISPKRRQALARAAFNGPAAKPKAKAPAPKVAGPRERKPPKGKAVVKEHVRRVPERQSDGLAEFATEVDKRLR